MNGFKQGSDKYFAVSLWMPRQLHGKKEIEWGQMIIVFCLVSRNLGPTDSWEYLVTL